MELAIPPMHPYVLKPHAHTQSLFLDLFLDLDIFSPLTHVPVCRCVITAVDCGVLTVTNGVTSGQCTGNFSMLECEVVLGNTARKRAGQFKMHVNTSKPFSYSLTPPSPLLTSFLVAVDECRFDSCAEGYELDTKGSAVRKCERVSSLNAGQWSGTPTTCKRSLPSAVGDIVVTTWRAGVGW